MKVNHSVFWLKIIVAILMAWGSSQAYATHCVWDANFSIDSVTGTGKVSSNKRDVSMSIGETITGTITYTLVQEVWIGSGDSCFIGNKLDQYFSLYGFDWYMSNHGISDSVPAGCNRIKPILGNYQGYKRGMSSLRGHFYNDITEVWPANCGGYTLKRPFYATRSNASTLIKNIDATFPIFAGIAAGQYNNNLDGSIQWCRSGCTNQYLNVSENYPTCSMSAVSVVLPRTTPASISKDYHQNVAVPFSINVTCTRNVTPNTFKVVPTWYFETRVGLLPYYMLNTGTATSVAIVIFEKDSGTDKMIYSGYKEDSAPLPPSSSPTKEFKYEARYLHMSSLPVGPGDVKAVATVTMNVE